MSKSRIPETTWRRAREDWISCLDPVATIAARHDIGTTALSRRAKRDAWPPRGSVADDPAVIARRLYADITVELRASLHALQNPDGSAQPATAAQRGTLIRAHRRALIALLDARKPLNAKVSPSPASTQSPEVPALDLAAARADILDRLARMDAAPPADLAP